MLIGHEICDMCTYVSVITNDEHDDDNDDDNRNDGHDGDGQDDE